MPSGSFVSDDDFTAFVHLGIVNMQLQQVAGMAMLLLTQTLAGQCGITLATMLCCWSANVVIDNDLSGAVWHRVCTHVMLDVTLSILAAVRLSQTFFVIVITSIMSAAMLSWWGRQLIVLAAITVVVIIVDVIDIYWRAVFGYASRLVAGF
ncbi:hypothetical protein Tco_0966621 [Tanacetum coccineum]